MPAMNFFHCDPGMDTTISGLLESRTNIRSSRHATSTHSPVTHAVLLRQNGEWRVAIGIGSPPMDRASITCRH
jgi:hypothetical protein